MRVVQEKDMSMASWEQAGLKLCVEQAFITNAEKYKWNYKPLENDGDNSLSFCLSMKDQILCTVMSLKTSLVVDIFDYTTSQKGKIEHFHLNLEEPIITSAEQADQERNRHEIVEMVTKINEICSAINSRLNKNKERTQEV